MVGRKITLFAAAVAVAGACGPAARPAPRGPTPAELEEQTREQARQEAEVRAQAKAEQLASPGMSPALAIEVCKPEGQRAYLSRLRCPGGERPAIVGRSSVGLREPASEGQDELIKAQFERAPEPGEPHLHVVDRYDVDCGDGEPLSVYLDMYHCPATPTAAVPLGLELAAEGDAPVAPAQTLTTNGGDPASGEPAPDGAAAPDGEAPPAPTGGAGGGEAPEGPNPAAPGEDPDPS